MGEGGVDVSVGTDDWSFRGKPCRVFFVELTAGNDGIIVFCCFLGEFVSLLFFFWGGGEVFQVMIGRFVGLENDGKTLFFCSKGMEFHFFDVQLLGGVDWVGGWVGGHIFPS